MVELEVVVIIYLGLFGRDGACDGGNVHVAEGASTHIPPGRAPLINPMDDVIEHELNVVVRFTIRQAMPHAGVKLELLIFTLGLIKELPANFRVGHSVLFAMKEQEGKGHL